MLKSNLNGCAGAPELAGYKKLMINYNYILFSAIWSEQAKHLEFLL